MNSEQLHQSIVTLHDDALNRLRKIAGDDFTASISITWNRRMRSSAGRAFLLKNKVELNPRLLHVYDSPEQSHQQVRQTLLHELAHLLAHHRHGLKISAHGAEWKQACCDLGIPGESATHELPLPRRKQRKKWRYICPSCKESIDRVRRMKAHSACYSCCKDRNNGNYHKKYQFTEYSLSYQ